MDPLPVANLVQAALQAISQATGGRFRPIAEAGKVPELLQKILPQPKPHLRRVHTTLWDRLWLL
jgi:hypothetical protein